MHTRTTSLAECDWVQEDSQTRFDAHRELALVYSMSINRIYKGQPRFKHQTVALGRSIAKVSGLAWSPGIRPREGREMQTGRPEGKHLLPSVCPSARSPSHGAQGGAERPVPFPAISIMSSNCSSSGLFPEKEIIPTAFECMHRAQPLDFCKMTWGRGVGGRVEPA